MCLAVPGLILSIRGEGTLDRTGRVSFGGIIKDVNLAYMPQANVGDYIIANVGFGIQMVDEQDALRVFKYLEKVEELKTLHNEDKKL